MNTTAKTAAPAKPVITVKKTAKRFEGADAPVTVVAATPSKGHKIPAPAIVTPTGIALTTAREGKFEFITADAVVQNRLADTVISYLKDVGVGRVSFLLRQAFPETELSALVKRAAPKTPKAPRAASVRVARNKIDDTALLKFINDNGLASARIQAILDSVRAAGCSASQERVDRLLGRVTAA